MKAATAYKRGDFVYLHSSSKTTAGVWIATAPFARVDQNASLEELGMTAQKALAESRTNVPHPSQWNDLIAPLLQLAGVKTWKSFAASARSVSIESNENEIRTIPTKNLGRTEGFEEMTEKAIGISEASSVRELGEALARAMQLCE